MLILNLSEVYGSDNYDNSVLAGNLLPEEAVKVEEIPSHLEFKPQWFALSRTYGIIHLDDLNPDEYMKEVNFVKNFVLPEFDLSTFQNQVLGKTNTYEKFLKNLPELKWFWWNKEEKIWVPHYRRVWWLPTYQFKTEN